LGQLFSLYRAREGFENEVRAGAAFRPAGLRGGIGERRTREEGRARGGMLFGAKTKVL